MSHKSLGALVVICFGSEFKNTTILWLFSRTLYLFLVMINCSFCESISIFTKIVKTCRRPTRFGFSSTSKNLQTFDGGQLISDGQRSVTSLVIIQSLCCCNAHDPSMNDKQWLNGNVRLTGRSSGFGQQVAYEVTRRGTKRKKRCESHFHDIHHPSCECCESLVNHWWITIIHTWQCISHTIFWFIQ